MQTKTKGIVLHQVKYTDSSNIVSIYTRQLGKISFIIRRSNNKKAIQHTSLLQPLSVVEINFSFQPKRSIHHINELKREFPFSQIPFDPIKSSVAIFMAEILGKTLRYTDIDEQLYDFLETSVLELDKCNRGVGNFHLSFMMQLSEYLGFSPNKDQIETARFFDLKNGIFEYFQPEHPYFLQPETTAAFKVLVNINFDKLDELSLSKSRRTELLHSLVEYYQLHIAGFQNVRSLDVLQHLWS